MKDQIITIAGLTNCDNLTITRKFMQWHVVFTLFVRDKQRFAEGVDSDIEKAVGQAYFRAKELLEL